VLGAGDRLIPPADGVRLAGAASGPTDFVVYEESNHLGFNIPYGGAAIDGRQGEHHEALGR